LLTTSTTPNLSFNASNTGFAVGASVSGSYLQSLLQNKSGTAGASVNYVLSNNLGTDSTYYGEFGMNSSVYSASTPSDFFSINNGIYFSGHDGDMTFGSGNGFKSYFAWGSSGQSAHVINASGALGFSTNLGATPALSGTTGYGTAGQVPVSAGSTGAVSWSSTPTLTGTNFTGVPISTAISGLGTGVASALSIAIGSAGAPITFNGALGTPSSGTLTNATGLPVSTGISGLGTGVAIALAVAVGSAGAFVVNGGALGTPSSGTLTNTTGFPAANLAGTALPSAVVSSSLTSVGTITTGTWSGLFGSVSGANLTNITGANVTGTVASATTAATANALNTANSYTVAGLTVNGNLGIGTTPSAWYSLITATQNKNISLWSNSITQGVAGNLYRTGAGYTSTYINTSYAAEIEFNGGGTGGIQFNLAPSGTAGTSASLTQAMTLFQSGGLSLGNTTDPGATNLSVTGSVTAASFSGTWASIPAGTVMLFQQTAAPTGWTKLTTNNNAALRIVSGTAGTGGTVAFTTAFASQTPAGSVGTSITGVSGSVGISGGSVAATTLDTTMIPAHAHTYSGTTSTESVYHQHSVNGTMQSYGAPSISSVQTAISSSATGNQNALHTHTYSGTTNNNGSGASHTHGFTAPSGSFTFSSGTASSSFTGTAINLAVQYVDVIAASKN